jgi:hypothetical protein
MTPQEGDIDVLRTGPICPWPMPFSLVLFACRAAEHISAYDAPTDQWFWFHVVDALSFLGGQVKTHAAEGCSRVASALSSRGLHR